MKQFMKRAYFRLKYRNKNIRFAHGTVIGMNASFEGCNRIGKGTTFNGKLGYGSYLGGNSKINGRIGKFCCIASGVSVINGFHPTDAVSIHPAFFSTKRQCGMTYAAQNIYEETREAEPGYPIVIGNDVWIGQNALLFAGARGPLVCFLAALVTYLMLKKGSSVKKIIVLIFLGIAILIIALLWEQILLMLSDFATELGVSSRTIELLLNGEFLSDSGRWEIQKKSLTDSPHLARDFLETVYWAKTTMPTT